MKRRYWQILIFSAAASILAGCGTSQKDGKYYDNDGPPSALGTIGMETKNAVPKVEKPIAATNRPYKVMGKTYVPMTGDKPLVQTGYGSWYGKQFHGKKTSTGEIYDMYAMTAAHTTMELPSYAKVTNLENGRSIIVRVNDRGPFLHSRVIDLSYAAASRLGYVNKGTAKVKVERITRAQIAAGNIPSTTNGSVLASIAAPVAKKVLSSSESGSTKESDFIAQVATLAAEGESLASSSSPSITADRVIIEKDQPPLNQNPVERVLEAGAQIALEKAGNADQTTLNTFETEAKAEVISEMKKHASESQLGQAVNAASAVKQYAVQLGVFRSEQNALKLKQQFTEVLGDKMGAQVRIELVNGLHKVVVGSGMTEAQAKAATAIVRDALNIKAFVLKE